MKMLRFGAVLLLLCGMAFASTASFTQPRLAIFLSKTSYHHAWETSHLAGHGWVGIATLAGFCTTHSLLRKCPAIRNC